MADKIIKLMSAFYAAKRVDHYYWMHTDGDDGLVSIENIQQIIEWLTNVRIEKYLVTTDSEFHRAFVERFSNGEKIGKIYVLENEDESWRRFSAVKEMCHILIDGDDDFQSDPCVTIHKLKESSFSFDEDSAPETDSEHLAEMIAMELLYPLDYRREDRLRLERGVTLKAIADERKIPTKYISLGTSDVWFELCITIWKNLRDVEPPNLNDLVD